MRILTTLNRKASSYILFISIIASFLLLSISVHADCNSCNACLYTPSCPCTCSGSGTGASVSTYSNTYSCSGGWNAEGVTGLIDSITLPSSVESFSCSSSAYISSSDNGCNGETNCGGGGCFNTYLNIQTCIGSDCSNIYSNADNIYNTGCGSYSSSCFLGTQNYDITKNCSYGCSQGSTLNCYGYNTKNAMYESYGCGGTSCTVAFDHVCTAFWTYQKTVTQNDNCQVTGCVGDDGQTGCSSSCASCTGTCSYIPQTPNCQCFSPYNGGGCASYTPPENPAPNYTPNYAVINPPTTIFNFDTASFVPIIAFILIIISVYSAYKYTRGKK